MDKNLVDKIVNTSFFNVDDAAELFKENGVSQIKILANGTILCGAAEKCSDSSRLELWLSKAVKRLRE